MESEPIGYLQIHIQGDLLQELAHIVMEAERSHDLPSANWRIRKDGGII